jgi:hypothetical protein
VEGADQNSGDLNDISGTKMTIHVEDFGSPPCTTERTMSSVKGPNNFIEFGWVKVGTSPHVVFYNVIESGMVHPHVTGHTPSGGEDKTFQIENSNQDNSWELDYEGNVVDHVSQGYHVAAYPLSNSEKEFSQDDLWAHFFSINICTQQSQACGGNYHSPANFSHYTTSNDAANWKYCNDGNTENHVKPDGTAC